MARSSSRKRRSTSSSPGDSSATKRSKGKCGGVDENKENSTLRRHEDGEAVASSPGDEVGQEEEGVEPEAEAEVEDAADEDFCEDEKNDNEEEEEELEAENEEERVDTTASAARGRKKSNAGPGKTTEAGIIKTIYCENFMCHRKLRVDLNRNVNFIHGQNGSGKSAILAAIQICLGAGARRTHRARNLKELVRKDSTASAMPSCAKVRVTLLNQGSDAYNHDVYGDTITVERTISLKGGYNGYKLLDHKLVEKSRSKKDLDDMLDTLNIQVENPVAVMDQEESKKFLMGKAEDKYQFFMKATELERIDRTFASTLDTVSDLQDTNFRIKQSMQTSVEHVEELKQKWKEHQELGKLESKLLKLGTEYAWAVYNVHDGKYDKTVEDKEKAVEKARKKEEELRQAEEAAGTPGNDGDSKRNEVDKLLEEAQSQAQLKRELEEELKEAMGPYKEVERKLSGVKKTLNSATTQLKRAKQSLQEARDQIMANADSAESEEAHRTEMLKKLEEDLASARAKVDELKQDQSKWLRSYEEIEPHVRDAKSKVDQLNKRLQGVQHTLRSLQSSTGRDSLALFGPRVATVAQLVDKAKQQNKFRGEVTGPIGSFLKVAPGMEKFASIAEQTLGHGTLDRFIVTNDHDNSVMRDIRKQAGCSQDCGIFQVYPSNRYLIPAKLDIDGIETVASVLTIENDMVFNCLIDNARLEQKALALDQRYSEQQLLIKNAGGCAIRGKINEVYFLPKGDHWTVKGGAFAVFSNENKALRQTIGVDKSSAIADALAEEASIKEEISARQQEESKLQHEHTNSQREWNRAKKAVQQNDSLISDLTEKIDSIKEDMEASANVTIDTTEFEEDVQQAEELLAKYKADEQKYLVDKVSLLPHINDVKSRLDDCIMRNAKVLLDIKAAERDLTQFLDTQTQQNDQIEKKRHKLQNYQEAARAFETAIEEISALREKYLKKARTMHFRFQQRQVAEEEPAEDNDVPHDEIQTEPTEEQLEAIEPISVKNEPKFYEVRMQKIKDKIQKERERRNVSREDAAAAFERYSRAQNDLSTKMEQVDNTDARIAELQKDVTQRRKRWQQFRHHLAKTMGIKFGEMLALNKYYGTLDFDHDALTLDLAVQKDTADSQVESKDVKALSGGEKSFTTVSLLIALGESLETPFRILDEFDVFLDAETRKLVIKSLIHVAKSLNHRQFIFITPQDLSSITQDDQVKILKLHPPDRHQNAGGPTQQTLSFASHD